MDRTAEALQVKSQCISLRTARRTNETLPLAVPFDTSYEHCPSRQGTFQSFSAKATLRAKRAAAKSDLAMEAKISIKKMNEGRTKERACRKNEECHQDVSSTWRIAPCRLEALYHRRTMAMRHLAGYPNARAACSSRRCRHWGRDRNLPSCAHGNHGDVRV